MRVLRIHGLHLEVEAKALPKGDSLSHKPANISRTPSLRQALVVY